MTDVIMPQMGESIAEGTVTKWLKKIGDPVKRDEPLFEISTDKVDAEIPSPIAGVLTEILIQPGTTVEVGTVVGRIGVAGSVVAAPAQATAPPPPLAVAPAPVPTPPRPPVAPPPPPAPAPVSDAPTFSGGNFVSERPREGMTTGELRMARSSPVVRKIAQEYGVDINEVPGTGLGGRVTREDILSYVESRKSATIKREAPPTPYAPAPAAAPPAPPVSVRPPVVPPPVPVVPPPVPRIPAPQAADPGPTTMRFTPASAGTPAPPPVPVVAPPAPSHQTGPVAARPASARVEVVPMSPIRKKTADHMVLSKRTSAHVSTVWEVDMTRVAALRAKYKPLYEERSGVNLTYTPFIVKAATDAIKAFKVLNASVEGDSIVYHKDINVGIAVALDWGLIVPVVPAADEKNVLGLARAVNDLGERARTKKLKVDEVQGGTFTITNPGVFGSLFGTPIIPQPQVAILGVGTIEKRPVVRDDAIAIRTMAYFCLTFDHRIIDGSEADKFMAHLKNGLQNFDESAL